MIIEGLRFHLLWDNPEFYEIVKDHEYVGECRVQGGEFTVHNDNGKLLLKSHTKGCDLFGDHEREVHLTKAAKAILADLEKRK